MRIDLASGDVPRSCSLVARVNCSYLNGKCPNPPEATPSDGGRGRSTLFRVTRLCLAKLLWWNSTNVFFLSSKSMMETNIPFVDDEGLAVIMNTTIPSLNVKKPRIQRRTS